MSYTVYVLYSDLFRRTYIGQTNDLVNRLKRHNAGLVISTRSFKPWRVVYTEIFITRGEAMKREKWMKSGTGREFIKSLLSELGILTA